MNQTSSDRIPCTHCGAMILEVTARRNTGLCAPCAMIRGRDEFQTQCEELRKNPPKSREEIDRLAPPGDMSSIGLGIFLDQLCGSKPASAPFKKQRFLEELKKVVVANEPDGDKVSVGFLGLFDLVIQESGSLMQGLKKLPRPYREAMAVYQLWGMMTSDGLDSYLENSDRKVDAEVDRGLKLFERSDSRGVVERARKAFDPMEGLPDELEAQLEDVLYRDLDEFEARILGPFLIKTLASK